MDRGTAISEIRWPETPDFVGIARAWQADASKLLVGLVWQAFDLLVAEVFEQIDVEQVDSELERNITQLLEARIHRLMPGELPFYVQHGPYEYETRLPPPAQPPLYDIAYVLYSNERVMWPLEAKVMRTEGRVAPYIADIKEQYIPCRYAPFSGEGAMVGYLLSGDTSVAISKIAEGLGAEMLEFAGFETRPHRISSHDRLVPEGKTYPKRFTCHHLIMSIPRGSAETPKIEQVPPDQWNDTLF